jgi:hypothetical protein
MHFRMAWPVGFLLLVAGVFTTLSLTRGQDQSTSPLSGPGGKVNPGQASSSADPVATAKPPRDLAKLDPLQKQTWLSAQRGAEWLFRANGPDGRFNNGIVPALRTTMDGDQHLRQVGAAATLALAARFSGDQRYAARATQAIVTLLADTVPETRDPQVRHTLFPPGTVNPLAAAGLLVLAIHELPEPDKDLLAKAEQLCNYIHKQQQADGSLNPAESADADGVNIYAGAALVGVIRSQQRQPAAWKLDLVRNALSYYKAWWRQHKNMAFVPGQTAAYTEAYVLTKERPFAEFVFEMNDWLAGLQYQGFDDPKQVYWSGGFKSWADGKPMETMPQVFSASYAESLAEACRAAREAGDLERHKTYSAAVERCLPFLTTLQYTETNTQHFADWYRPTLLGGFHLSHQNGDLRLDYTQFAVSAMVQYLTHVARVQ